MTPHLQSFKYAIQMDVTARWLVQEQKEVSPGLTWRDKEYGFMGHWWCR